MSRGPSTLLITISWAADHDHSDKPSPARIPFLAALAGSTLTRTVSRAAYLAHGRSVVTQDMLPYIGKAFEEVFDDKRPSANSRFDRDATQGKL